MNSFRRDILRSALAIGCMASLAAAPIAKAQPAEITVMLWGTTWQASIKDASEQFTKETGIKVNYETQTSSGEGLVKLRAMRARPTVDVWFTTASVAARAADDTRLFAKLPLDKMPNVAQTIPNSVNDNFAAFAAFPLVITYRADMLKNPPTRWEDLWGPDYRNKLALPNMGMYQGRTLLVAARLAGGNERNVNLGFEKLKALKPNVALFYASDAQARQAVAQGEASVLLGPPSLARFLSDQGVNVRTVALRPTPLEFDVAMIVKTGKEEMSARFINFLLRQDINEMNAKRRNMSPTNVKAGAPEALAGLLPSPQDALVFDERIINENIAEWTERFNREIAN